MKGGVYRMLTQKAASGPLLFCSLSDYCVSHFYSRVIALPDCLYIPCRPAPVFLADPISQARSFSLQSSIAVYLSCQGPLTLDAENLPPRHTGERIYRALLVRSDRQSLEQKK